MRVVLRLSMRAAPRVQAFARFLGTVAPESSWVTCPECGTPRVKRLARRDRIDRLSDSTWSALQQRLGGKLYHCALCRLQFYDCRRPEDPAISVLSRACTGISS